MRTTKGGTDMYCPKCDDIKVLKGRSPAVLGDEKGQRVYMAQHPDLQIFQRCRECLTCGHKFMSAEIPEAFLYELMKLREALSDIKKNAEEYVVESSRAATSLQRLTDSLKLLRALEIYQRTPRQ
jgi:hypothetical protein